MFGKSYGSQVMTEDYYEYTQINIVDIICIRFNTYVHGLSSIT